MLFIFILSIAFIEHQDYTGLSLARLAGMDQRWQLLAHLDRLEKVQNTTAVLMSLIDAQHIITQNTLLINPCRCLLCRSADVKSTWHLIMQWRF